MSYLSHTCETEAVRPSAPGCTCWVIPPSNSGGNFWIWTLNSGVQQPHTGYYREMIYMENWLWKHHLPLIFKSSSWVKIGPPSIGSIKMHLATHRMSRAPRQHCSVTPKLPRTKNHSELRRGSVEPLDASPEWGCPRRGPQLPNSLEQDLSRLTCCWHVAFDHLLPLPDRGSPEARREMLHLDHTESWSCGWSWPQHRLTFHGFMSPSLPLLSDDD